MAPASIKLAVVGSKGCGKSALTVRFLTKRFIGEYDSNTDVCVTREMQVADKLAELHIKDTAGCVWLKGPSALIGWSSAIVIVYSITDARSFELAKYIIEDLNIGRRLDPSAVLLLGNKNDLGHLREIPYSKGRKLAISHGFHFQETSAAADFEGVDTTFRKLLLETLTVQQSRIQTSDDSLNHYQRRSSVVRDFPDRRSLRRSIRRTSTGSHDSMRDSLSSTSDDERLHVTYHENILNSSPSPEASPCTSPALTSGKRRKISLPILFDRFGRTQKNYGKQR